MPGPKEEKLQFLWNKVRINFKDGETKDWDKADLRVLGSFLLVTWLAEAKSELITLGESYKQIWIASDIILSIDVDPL